MSRDRGPSRPTLAVCRQDYVMLVPQMVWQLPNTWHMVYQKADFNISCLDACSKLLKMLMQRKKKRTFEHLFWLKPLPYGLTWLSSGAGPLGKTLASLLSHFLFLLQ